MKKSAIFLAVLFVTVAGGFANAADTCNAAPACVSTPVCTTPSAGSTVTVAGPGNTTETFGVPTPGPGQKVEWIEETFKDLEPRIETVKEVRTRMVTKKHNVVKTKTVSEAKLTKEVPPNGSKKRLARGMVLREKTYLKKEAFQEQEEYLHPVQQTVYYEVDKIRRVPALVDDKKCD